MNYLALSLGLLLLPACGVQAKVKAAPSAALPAALQPFALSQVRLLPGQMETRREANRKYLLSLSTDTLLWTFRKNAGLPTPGAPLGGWENPGAGWRGFFVGHYLSACALMYAGGNDPVMKARGDYLVAELAKCQTALNQDGYLSAFPTSEFDDLEAGKAVPVPYYTIHKIMAGLVDMYQLGGNRQALQVAERMADYFKARTDRLSSPQMAVVLNTEFGGMANVLYDLYGINHRPADMALAHRFEQASFLDPLAHRQDDLAGFHANTHIPVILGAARRYELTGDADSRTITTYFWDQLTQHHSYATGGSNVGEHWGEPDKLAHTLSGDNQENCTNYNVLKVTRDLIRWTGNPKYADFYERDYFNGLLPAQRPDTGMMLYYLPLAAGKTKQWGTPKDSFWCCYGTGIESYAKLNDSIYFHDKNGLYVNLYVASEVTWPEYGVRIVQKTRFPEEQGSTFVVHVPYPTLMALHLRVPGWAQGFKVIVNGKPAAINAAPASYATLRRVWKEGDTVHVATPMHLHSAPMPDDPSIQSFMFGPLVLAGVMDAGTPLTPDQKTTGYLRENSLSLSSWLTPVLGHPLTFRTVGQPHNVTFVPLYQVIDQPYGVYWSVVAPGSARDQAIQAAGKARLKREARIVDSVHPNNAASEKEHHLAATHSNTGAYGDGGWRDGEAFQWDLKTLPDTPMTLGVTYWGDDAGRTFDILVDGQKIATQVLNHNKPGQLFEVEYSLPVSLKAASGSSSITVRFEAHAGNTAGGVFDCATLKPSP